MSEFLPTRWRQKSTGIDMKGTYVTVTLCIPRSQNGLCVVIIAGKLFYKLSTVRLGLLTAP